MAVKRRTIDTSTLLLPGIIEMTRLPDGTASVRIKEFQQEVDVAKACKLLGCGRETLYALIESGEIAARRLRPVPKSKFKVCAKSVEEFRAKMYQAPA